jgi:hypothetical protein
MRTDFDYTIVYVFGPEQCEDKYFKDEVLSREAGEWVKIGETGFRGNIENITDEEVAKMKDAIKNKPFIAMLNMLLENSGVNAEEIKMPEWLSFETVEKITEMLNADSDAYYD